MRKLCVVLTAFVILGLLCIAIGCGPASKPTVEFQGWYVDGNKVDTASKGNTVTAVLNLSGGSEGEYVMRIKKDVNNRPDDIIEYNYFMYAGDSQTVEVSFVPPHASGESGVRGYHVELGWIGTDFLSADEQQERVIWTLENSYPPRLTVY